MLLIKLFIDGSKIMLRDSLNISFVMMAQI